MISIRKNVYVISGGPGFGKSSLINALKKKGFYCGEDVAREFIKEQIRIGGKTLPWNNRLEFSKIILKKRVKQYKDAPNGKICFFDRGILDLIGYIVKEGLKVPTEFYKVVEKYKYQEVTFFTPPWQKIFNKKSKRRESFNDAVAIHNSIKKVYKRLGYKTINLPKTSADKRAVFILSKI